MFRKKKNDKENDIEKIFCEISHLEDTLLILQKRSDAIINEQAELRKIIEKSINTKPDYSESKEKYSPYEKGTFNASKENFFDSPAEKILEQYLNSICQKYSLGQKRGVRLLSHQPLINYIEVIPVNGINAEKLKAVNTKNALMHFDFLFEIRHIKSGGGNGSEDKSGHYPLLAIELDGKFHHTDKQRERDEYKQGVCDKIGLPLIRIDYTGENFTTDNIEADYLENILVHLFSSILDLNLRFKNIYHKETKRIVLEEQKDQLQNDYPEEIFPELSKYINSAYNKSLEKLEETQ